jgi:hypothetical protein
MEILEFGCAPTAAALGFKLKSLVHSSDDELIAKYTSQDLIFVRGPAISGRSSQYEFARFERRPGVMLKITRDLESNLYKYMRRNSRDAFQYEMLVKKTLRVADGVGSLNAELIVWDWLCAMHEEAASSIPQHSVERVPFGDVRRGKVENPLYQAFLDTLEHAELNAINSNLPYFIWHSDRLRESNLKQLGSLAAYCRQWADEHLSQRVIALRALC